jgi:hypothetical protein
MEDLFESLKELIGFQIRKNFLNSYLHFSISYHYIIHFAVGRGNCGVTKEVTVKLVSRDKFSV